VWFKRPESVLVLIVSAGGRVLLMERNQPAGFWQSVTGSLEEGEAPFDTALREVQEETGIDIVAEGLTLVDWQRQLTFPILPAWRHRYAPEVHHNLEHQFLLELPATRRVRLQEHRRYRWLAVADALAWVSSSSNRAAIEFWLQQRKSNTTKGTE